MTTKVCQQCGSTVMIPLRSQNLKICNNCKTTVKWELDADQAPVMTSSRNSKGVKA